MNGKEKAGNMRCKICSYDNPVLFSARVLSKYSIDYYYCSNCGFIQTEEPFWLEESYKDAINLSDTGILSRNISLSKYTSVIINLFFNRNKKFLDYAGGYGIFTRLMRDKGFDFLWTDIYAKNLLSRGFESAGNEQLELLTAFEVLEHLSDPLKEIENMLTKSRNILFSTELVPIPVPAPENWWYYAFEHGQHISFYSTATLQYIAKKYSLYYYTNGKNLHLFTEKKINKILWSTLILLNISLLQFILCKGMKSKTVSDMKMMINQEKVRNESTL